MLASRWSALGCLSRASCTSYSCVLQSVSRVLCSLKCVAAKKGQGVWRRVMVAFHAGARHRYVIEYVSLLANTISHIATHCHCYTVFSPCSAIRQRVYCKSDKRWGVSTRCGQTTVVHHQCIHSTPLWCTMHLCTYYQESTLRSTLENVALLEGSVTCCVAKMHCGEYSKVACKE